MPHKMEKVMSEFKAGDLKSGGDKTVKNRKQADAPWFDANGLKDIAKIQKNTVLENLQKQNT